MSTALYRKHRPESFADVIGQEHVTGPLMQALRKDRVHHAYLFSGPRGCGKTTSARILARCLNCEQGPTPEPCGVCDSCTDLARGGGGSLDVVEIDAASHGGVDDARDLRERASFAPARDQFKIYVIDEAHMVSTAGFNALLKLVEEPPEHVKFVFATTEPDKVIGTIRSRTHHYPFRLVPPKVLTTYLGDLCALEQVPVGKGVLPLVVRAGEGSVRDSLSVLDQLIAGAGDDGLDYELTVSLLGYTHASLLDDVVEALAAVDGAAVFRMVDRVIQSGHDPRRFVEDLLERLRDLIVVAAVPDDAQAVLRDVPQDQLDRMRGQASHFGTAELSRAADVVNGALTEMVGATSPRLHLELLCARLLLPGAEDSERGLRARMDRMERRIGVVGGTPPPPERPASAEPATPVEQEARAERPAPAQRPAPTQRPVPAERPVARDVPAGSAVAPAPVQWPEPTPPPAQRQSGADGPDLPAAVDGGGATGEDTEAVRRLWPDVLKRLYELNRGAWTMVSQNAKVLGVVDGRLRLGFDTAGQAQKFASSPKVGFVQQALIDVLGVDARIEAVAADQGAPGSASPATATANAASRPPTANSPAPAPTRTAPIGEPPSAPEPPADDAPPETDQAEYQQAEDEPAKREPAKDEPAKREPAKDEPAEDEPVGANRPVAETVPTVTGEGSTAEQPRRSVESVAPEHDEPSVDDPDAEDSGLVGQPVVAQILGGRVIGEHDSDRR